MRVPCIICKKLVETNKEHVIAAVCTKCNKGNLDKILKNLDYKKIKAMIPKVTKNGKTVNEYGEVI